MAVRSKLHIDRHIAVELQMNRTRLGIRTGGCRAASRNSIALHTTACISLHCLRCRIANCERVAPTPTHLRQPTAPPHVAWAGSAIRAGHGIHGTS
jgi:hypothetical protein